MQVCRGADRFCTRTDWLTSWHSFSYGQWYDAANVGFGPLVVHNHDVLAPGGGFDDHAHSGVDLVTYVVSGALEHRDSTGHEAVLRAGELQVLRSGSGVRHSERNASATEPVEYVQMWVTSDSPQVAYETSSPVRLAHADLHVVSSDSMLEGGRIHAYVVAGTVIANETRLNAGDAVRLVDEELRLNGTRATVLVWQFGFVALKPPAEAV